MANIQPWKVADKRGKKENRIPPFAPSKNEVSFYRKYLDLVSGNELPDRALILGATPELRDSAIDANLESWAVDISGEMMEKFSSLMKHHKHPFDKQQVKNWLEIDFPELYFGAVLGDASFINLTSRKHNRELAKVCSKIIKKGGYLILRQAVYTRYKGYDNALKLVDDFRSRKIGWQDLFIELRFNIFKNELYDKKTYQYNGIKNFELIDELYNKGILNKQEYERINRFRNNVTNTFYPEEEFVRMIESNGFKLVKRFHDKPYLFYNYLFMMTFRKT